MKLDKSKPFGTVFGDSLGRVYEQDGQHFRADGSLWEPDEDEQPEGADGEAAPAAPVKAKGVTKGKGKVNARAAIAAAPIQAAVKTEADAQVDAQLKG